MNRKMSYLKFVENNTKKKNQGEKLSSVNG